MRKRTLLGLLGAGLIYAGCGEELSSSSWSDKTDAQKDTVDTYDSGIDTKKEVKVDTAYDAGIDTADVKADTFLDTIDAAKDTLGLETEVNETYTSETADTHEVSIDAAGDAEEETSADVYQITFCPDLDKDGFFGTVVGEECYAPSGKDGDCKDNNKLIFPGAIEICDGIDNGCNGLTDEDIPNQSYYTGAAGTQNVGVCTSGVKSCIGGVWDITTPEVTPSLVELCDEKDNNCNGFTDEGLTNNIFYKDADGDENGDLYSSVIACSPPVGYVANHDDCDDNNKLIYLDADELCNGKDDDCDGEIDNGAVPLKYFFDGDSDGYGDANGTAIESCVALPLGYVINNTDCNDANAVVNPAAKESCNAIDDDCDTIADNGLEQVVKCGYNNNGTKTTHCVNGTVSDKTICADPDECKLGTLKDCDINVALPKLKCELDATTNTYKFKSTGSETSSAKPDGLDNNCNGQVDESFFVFVPAGEYQAGCDYPSECAYAGNPMHEVGTSGFYISKYEFTKTQAGTSGNLPETDVTKTEAETYCVSLGGRLPTANEWEIAAKGGVTENVYPWGTLLPTCNLTNSWYCSEGAEEVGSYPLDKSTLGTDDNSAIYDMGGNVSEWTSTLGGDFAFVKGGNWEEDPKYALVYYEQFKNPTEADAKTGFRCVLDEIN